MAPEGPGGPASPLAPESPDSPLAPGCPSAPCEVEKEQNGWWGREIEDKQTLVSTMVCNMHLSPLHLGVFWLNYLQKPEEVGPYEIVMGLHYLPTVCPISQSYSFVDWPSVVQIGCGRIRTYLSIHA